MIHPLGPFAFVISACGAIRRRGSFPVVKLKPRNLRLYSPDLNPIEQPFSKLKQHLRKADIEIDSYVVRPNVCLYTILRHDSLATPSPHACYQLIMGGLASTQ
jgi:hypothetical protein